MNRHHPKLLGELAEALFLARAVTLHLRVSKPWGDSSPYDFLVETAAGFLRIQVKSARAPARGCYRIAPTFGSRKRPYSRRHIDFVAAYIAPADTWYIIPVRFLARRQTIWFCPADPRRKPSVEPFREAWHLLGAS